MSIDQVSEDVDVFMNLVRWSENYPGQRPIDLIVAFIFFRQRGLDDARALRAVACALEKRGYPR